MARDDAAGIILDENRTRNSKIALGQCDLSKINVFSSYLTFLGGHFERTSYIKMLGDKQSLSVTGSNKYSKVIFDNLEVDSNNRLLKLHLENVHIKKGTIFNVDTIYVEELVTAESS